MKQISCQPKSAQSGVVIIEVMVAILLFSVGVLAIAGLQTTMLKDMGDSQFRVEASYLAQQKLGEMYADIPGTLIGTYNTTSSVDLPEGTISVTQAVVRGPYQIQVLWTQPGDPEQHNYTVLATVVPTCYPGDPGCP